MTLEFFTIDIFQDQNILPSLIFMYNDHTLYFLGVSYYKQKFHVHCGARWPINEWDVICKGAGWEVIITQYYIPPVFSVFRSLSYRCRFLSLSSPSTTRLSSPTTKFLLSISLTVLSLSSASVSASLFGPQLTDVCVLRKVTLCLQHQQIYHSFNTLPLSTLFLKCWNESNRIGQV